MFSLEIKTSRLGAKEESERLARPSISRFASFSRVAILFCHSIRFSSTSRSRRWCTPRVCRLAQHVRVVSPGEKDVQCACTRLFLSDNIPVKFARINDLSYNYYNYYYCYSRSGKTGACRFSDWDGFESLRVLVARNRFLRRAISSSLNAIAGHPAFND